MKHVLSERLNIDEAELRILFVEDNPGDVELALWQLKREGFQVRADVVQTPEELLARLKTEVYELILADYRLPGWTGLEALAIVRAEGKEIPFVLVTGSLGEQTAVDCIRGGVSDYVLKDRLMHLPVVVCRILEERNLRDQRSKAERALLRSELSHRSLVRSAVHAIFRYNPSQDRFLEVNPALVEMLGYSSEDELLEAGLARGVYRDPAAAAVLLDAFQSQEKVKDLEAEWERKDGEPIAVRMSGHRVLDEQGAVICYEIIAENVTGHKRAQQRIAQLNRLYSVLTHVSQAVVRIHQRDRLLQEVCRVAVEHGGFRMAWIGMVEEGTSQLKPVAWRGWEQGYLEQAAAWPAEEPAGAALRDGRHVVCNDIQGEAGATSWGEEALRRGYRSAGSFPVRVRERGSGSFTIYGSEPGLFDEENVALLDELAADVSFALDRMELEQRRQRAEEALERLHRHTELILNSAGEGIYGLDRDGNTTFLNPPASRMLGWEAGELVGRSFHALACHSKPDGRPYPPEESPLYATLNSGATRHVEDDVFWRKDGASFPVEYVSTPIHDRGELIGAVVVFNDISARKRGEEAMARLAAIVESSEDAIIARSLEGIVLTWNSGAERLYGFTAQEAVGRPISFLLPPDRLHEVPALQGKAERRTTVRHYETVRVRKDGVAIPVLLTVSPVRDASGEMGATSESARDITERKRLEDQLRRQNEELAEQNRIVQMANRMKSEFLANMSHELRTPLNAIIGFGEMLSDGKLGAVSGPHVEILGDILTSARHLLRLINDVLDLSKVESGKLEFEPEPVELEKLVQEVTGVLHALASKKAIGIATEISPELGEVVLDPGKLKQVLYNYLSNALKFTPEEGRVTVRAQPDGNGQFCLEVEDSGIGIQPEDLGRLFVEFQQLDGSFSKKYQGTGLGLALTKRFVEAQGGRVGVRSRPGQGSVFFAILPKRMPMR